MGYMHIDNLSKNQTLLLFKECYALEKIHGTSAHIKWKSPNITFFSGGAPHAAFVAMFDVEALKAKFAELSLEDVTVYGELYGGKMQGMKSTYGDKLRFVAFDVQISDCWLNVEKAHAFVQQMGLEFVAYNRVTTDISVLDAQRDLPSRQAVRNGIVEPKDAEGVVLRPIIELVDNRGARVIAKHKRPEFSERNSKKDTSVDPGKAEVLKHAEAIAEEWVTPMRLQHVLDKIRGVLGRSVDMQDTRQVIEAMVEDVTREAGDEIVISREAVRAIGTATGRLFKRTVTSLSAS